MRYLFILLTLVLFMALPAVSQTFEWQAGFNGFLDNREYASINDPQTIFGSRTWGEMGATMSDQHRFRIGLNYLYEFGHNMDAHLPDVTMYYQFEDERFDIRIGAFPRNNLLNYPLALLSDTLLYYRPNIEGAYLAFKGNWGYQNVFIDWTSRQTDVQPERFIFGFSGRLHKGVLFLDHHLMMGHFAGAGIREPDFHLRDNGGFDLQLGMDLSNKTPLDSLSVSVGSLVSLDRIRGVDDGWQTPAGFLSQFTAMYGWFGMSGLYYRGQALTFLYGDPFYRLDQYGRLDFFLMPFHNKHINLKINFVLHFAENQVDYSQQILVSMTIQGFKPFKNP